MASVNERLNTFGERNWRLFQAHVPKGAYLPVGDLDGDCRICSVSWPCLVVSDVLKEFAAVIAVDWMVDFSEWMSREKELDVDTPEHAVKRFLDERTSDE